MPTAFSLATVFPLVGAQYIAPSLLPRLGSPLMIISLKHLAVRLFAAFGLELPRKPAGSAPRTSFPA